VPAVVESVAASNPTTNGLLSVYPAGGTDPGNAGVNFNGGDGQDNDLTAPLVSAVSPSGEETITNHSSGTVDVVVTILGYYQSPTAPGTPTAVSASLSGSTATLDWTAPSSDGGSAITSYTIAASPDNVVTTVDGDTKDVTLTGLTTAASDLFYVTATNALGSSAPTTYTPPGVIAGTVVAPNAGATPVAGDLITIFPNANTAAGTPSTIGTTTTDANGNWSFAVPPYSQLPADAQADAEANNGYLNVDAIGMGNATVGGTKYEEAAVAVRSVWVGTDTQSQPPSQQSSLAQPAMVMDPDQADASAQDTDQAEAATFSSENDPGATDANGSPIGNAFAAYAPPPTDQYGYQEVGGSGYDPNVAADGTDLTNAAITPATDSNPTNCCHAFDFGCGFSKIGGTRKTKKTWTIVGEWHANFDEFGNLEYSAGASSSIGQKSA
jgi:hypothetical protein